MVGDTIVHKRHDFNFQLFFFQYLNVCVPDLKRIKYISFIIQDICPCIGLYWHYPLANFLCR